MFTLTMQDLLRRNARDNKDKIAVIFNDQRITYGALHERAQNLSSWLIENGLRRGDRVGINFLKSIDEIVVSFATFYAGGVAVNINYQLVPEQVRFILGDCGAKFFFADRPRGLSLLKTGLPQNVERVVLPGGYNSEEKARDLSSIGSNAPHDIVQLIDVDLAAIMYTSGSTGSPKGVVLTHRNLILGARSVAKYLNSSVEDRVLSVLPFSFDYGLNQLNTTFLVGGTLVLQPAALPLEIVASIHKNHVTGLAGVPTIWISLVRALDSSAGNFPKLRYITNSGGAIPSNILERFPVVFPGAEIFLMYGLTEGFRSTYLPPDMFKRKMGSIGVAIPNVELFVVHPEKGLCGPNEEGELIHRGSLISNGYWNRPVETQQKIKPCTHLRPLIGEENVLFSGDIVKRDEDGYLWFVTRNDELIKSSGHRISPTEIEELVYRSGLVGKAAAFGVSDELLGQAVVIAVSPASGASFSEAALQQYCRTQFPSYMLPKAIVVFPDGLKENANGKLDRPGIKKEVLNRLAKSPK